MKKLKRIFALLVVVFLASLYIVTLVASLVASPQQTNMLKACIYSTIVIPIFLWAYTLIYRVLKTSKQKKVFDASEKQNLTETTDNSISNQS